MSKSFFRKVAYGLNIETELPNSPLDWAISQIQNVAPVAWSGNIPTGESLLKKNASFIYENRKVLRVRYKNDALGYRNARRELKFKLGKEYHEYLEYAIRHSTALKNKAPVYERFVNFWANHFAITDKDELPNYITGAMHREIIRPALTGSFEDLLFNTTTSWAMIHNLDNSKSIGPDSRKAQYRSQRGKTVTINENHARELLELHTVSPNAGYNQGDVVQLTYLMTGWRHPHSKDRLECNPVTFDWHFHQPGSFKILGRTYDDGGGDGESMLRDVIRELAQHEHCRKFISFKLCRHFITDYPTDEMVKPVIMAWEDTNGNLKSIHEAVLNQAFKYSENHPKFQNPEDWFLQVANLWELSWPASEKDMQYNFKERPNKKMRRVRGVLKQLGHLPFRPKQPNGFSDLEADWLSPELLLRRISLLNTIANHRRANFQPKLKIEKIPELIEKNFDNHREILALIGQSSYASDKFISLFASKWMLRA
ncbi:MAG: DUF1800 family protein [Rhodospirillales bacterium]|tara:strand:- start:4073 stop:5521 length:1449 start_codon:yes stop_codon:yes gene_type:complete